LKYCRRNACRKLRSGGRIDRFRWHIFARFDVLHRWYHAPVSSRNAVHHAGLALAAVLIVSLTLSSAFPPYAFAGTQLYDFGTPGDYDYDGTTVEVASNQGRLKDRQYTGSEANTSALYHFDETSGNAVNDVSSNNNDFTAGSTTPCPGASWEGGKIADPALDRNLYGSTATDGTTGCMSAADSPSLALSSQVTLEAYVKFNQAFDQTDSISRGLLDKGGYRLYFDESDGKLKFELDDDDTKTWNKVGGAALTPITPGINGNDGISSSWRQFVPSVVYALKEFNGSLYVGTTGNGTNLGTGEVWKYSGSNQTWTKVGGDGNGTTNWDTTQTEAVYALEVHSGALYAGLGLTAGDAEVWRYSGSGTTWTKVAGGGLNSSWTTANANEAVYALKSDGTYLYAGTGNTAASAAASDGDVWRCTNCGTSPSWTIIGGTNNSSGANVNSSWGFTATTGAYEAVYSLEVMGGTLYASLGANAAGTYGDAEVWRFNGSNDWTLVGGDGTGWANNTFEAAYKLTTDGTTLWVGLGVSASDAEVWACTSCGTSPSWTQIGGDNASNWNTGYLTVRGLAYVNSTLYASLGDSAGQAEVWAYSGSGVIWTKIGGDGAGLAGLKSWDASFTTPDGTSNVKEQAFLGTFNSKIVVGTGNTPQDAEVWQCDASCTGASAEWSQIGGQDFRSWGAANLAYVTSMAVNAGKLYIGTGTTNKHATIWEYNGSTWTQVGGGNLNLPANENWNNYEYVLSMASFQGDLYAGFGTTADDSDVWKYSGGSWTQAGGTTRTGTTVNNSWTDANNIEEVVSMTADETYLYVGTGATATDGDVWRFDGSTWGGLPIGGTRNDTNAIVNNSWAASVFERVQSLTVANGLLFAGLGSSAGDAEVWRWNGTNWGSEVSPNTTRNRIGGDGDATFTTTWNRSDQSEVVRESVRSLTVIGTTLYAALGDTNDSATHADAEVWSCSNCFDTTVYAYAGTKPNWTKIGGDGENSSWDNLFYERVSSLVGYKGHLYAALGSNNQGADYDAEIWEYDGAAWAKVGGDAQTADTWSGTYEIVGAMAAYNGRLYAGLGLTNNTTVAADAEIWEYGGNTSKILSSTTSSWTADRWYHVAGTYNGTTASLYVCDSTGSCTDIPESSSSVGAITLNDDGLALAIGSLHGGTGTGINYAGFNGNLDEVRVSSVARDPDDMVRSQFASTAQTIDAAAAQSRTGVYRWSGFDTTETLNGGTITYQLSDDDGATWKFWDGDSWESSGGSLNNANAESVINSNIDEFPVTGDGIKWRAILLGDGDERVTLNDVTINWDDDLTDPDDINAGTVVAKNQSGGAVTLTDDTWYNYPNPWFSWTAPDDQIGGGEIGASGVEGYYLYFGTSASGDPESTSGIINGGGAVQFQAGTTLTISSGMSNGATYYLRAKTRDNAENISDTAVTLFTYKFDNEVPEAPAAVSVNPASYTSSNSFTFFWPMAGDSAPNDPDPDDVGPLEASTLEGYQFKINDPDSGGAYYNWSALQVDTSGNLELPNGTFTAEPAWQEGQNTFSLRYKDIAGNYSTPVTVNFYYAGSAPSAPENLQVLPVTTEESPALANSFSFTWDQPAFFNGSITQYHYSVNKLPTETNTSQTTSRTLAAAPWATQQGKNTLYVVAEYASVDFYTQTPAPAPPTAVQIFDISNRDAQEYAISMKWIEPDKESGFDGYEIFRSADNVTYTSAGTSQSPVFIDANLESEKYYYKVKSKDNAGQYSADSSVVDITPTGRYTSPPALESGPTVTTKSFSAEVSWRTDRAASSFVEYGTDRNKIGKEKGGETIGTLDLVEDRTVKLTGLDPETTYYYQAVWVDQDGNQGRSDLLTFITGLRPKISEVKVTNITLDAATIAWQTTTVATSEIRYGKTKALGSTVDDSGNTGTKHTVRLEGLDDTSLYYFVIAGTDTDGNSLASDEYTFNTLTRPLVTDFAVEPVREAATTTLRFTWKTNVPSTSVISYAPAGSPGSSQSNADYVTDHEIQVTDLSENSPYTVQARSVDQYGNTAISGSLNITTPDDSRPPRITNLNIEVRSTGVGEAQKAQLIVTWETDEPSTSQIEYGPGISSDSYPSRTAEDTALTNNHTVIVPELEPAKIYHLRAVSRDRANNAGTSADTTAITGKVQRSVIDIIVSSLQRSLGFLGRLPFLSQ